MAIQSANVRYGSQARLLLIGIVCSTIGLILLDARGPIEANRFSVTLQLAGATQRDRFCAPKFGLHLYASALDTDPLDTAQR